MSVSSVHAVCLTPQGAGAIAVILVAGEGALGILRRLAASEKVERLTVGQSVHVALHHLADGGELDDVLLVRVGEQRYEVHVHGGIANVAAVLRELGGGGADVVSLERAAELGYFGETLEAEVQLALPQAATAAALRLLLAQPAALRGWVASWRARLEAGPGKEEFIQLRDAARKLLGRSDVLRWLLDPPRIAIVGPPNAGKSTLANALLGRQMAITSDMPGTTRDWVDAHTIFTGLRPVDGVPEEVQVAVTLVDTAGIRTTGDVIEEESISRTHQQAAEADLVLMVFDATRVPTEKELTMLTGRDGRRLVVLNKIDAGENFAGGRLPEAIGVSALQQLNLDVLMRACLGRLGLLETDFGELFLFSVRQRGVVEELAKAGGVTDAVRLLEQLAGGGFLE
jgi:tRNA modification GTPase